MEFFLYIGPYHLGYLVPDYLKKTDLFYTTRRYYNHNKK